MMVGAILTYLVQRPVIPNNAPNVRRKVGNLKGSIVDLKRKKLTIESSILIK